MRLLHVAECYVLWLLADTPQGIRDPERALVVMIHGPRQAGKSTLARSLISDTFPAEYVTFDDLLMLGAARASP